MSEDDGTRAARVRDYGIEGWRTFSWFDPPFPVSVYHRPLGAWVDLIRNAGLDLLAVREPISNDPRDAGVPRAVLLIAERPGPKTRLVVIDGPSGAGKTSVGDEVAVRLGWVHLDTGRIARAFGLRERSGLGRDAIVAVRVEGCAARVLLNGDDVTSMLSTPEIGSATAMVLADRTVEAEYDELVFHQIARLESTGCVVTGRGMGRELPQAVVRAWLDVPHGVRAARSGHAALDRDRTDRDRGRLEDVDPGSIRIDGTRAVADVAAVVTRLVHTRVGS
jgi:cytidylate kinase